MVQNYGTEALIAFLGIILSSAICAAQTSQPTSPSQPFLPLSAYPTGPAFYDRSQGDFGRGRFGLSFGAECLSVSNTRHDTLGFLTIGAEYFALKGISIGAEAELCPGTYEAGKNECLSDSRLTLRAAGGTLLLRGYVLQLRELSFYLDGGIGGMHAHTFPSQNVNNNWVQAIGCGASLRVSTGTFIFAERDSFGLPAFSFRCPEGRNRMGSNTILECRFVRERPD